MNNLSSSNAAVRAALVAVALLAASSARADNIFNVNTVDDRVDDNTSDGVCHTSANNCSLRAALMQANHLNTSSVTRIDVPAGTYVLRIPRSGLPFDAEDTGDLNITTPLNANHRIFIKGAGAASTIIDGNQTERVLFVDEDAIVTVEGVTIRNGATLSGAGIENVHASLTIADCIIEHNQASQGGGMYSSGDLTVVRSTFRSNTAVKGAGMYLTGDSVVRNSTLHGNGADDGGGIYNASGALYVVNSTLSLNFANTNGGGIWSSATTNLYNASVIGNDADHDRDENGGIGGGLYVAPGTAVFVSNSIVANNTILDAPIYDDCNGFLAAYGWNLFGVMDGCTIGGGNGMASAGLISTSSIGQLQNNGGPTWTHALLTGSEAIDSTFDSVRCYDENLDQLATDQRGALRPAGQRCDVGAFEYGATFDGVFASGFDE